MQGLRDLASHMDVMFGAGVLEFSAVEGTVAIPPLVARNLFGDGASAPPQGAAVTVTYRKLPKGRLSSTFSFNQGTPVHSPTAGRHQRQACLCAPAALLEHHGSHAADSVPAEKWAWAILPGWHPARTGGWPGQVVAASPTWAALQSWRHAAAAVS